MFFKKLTDKTCIPIKNHHIIETFTQAMRSNINYEIKNMQHPKFPNLRKKRKRENVKKT